MHWQLRGSRPHRRSLIPPLISSFWPPVCLKNQCEPRACSMPVASLGLSQFDHGLLPNFRCWRRITSNVRGAPIWEEKLESKCAGFASNLSSLCWILWSGTAANQQGFVYSLCPADNWLVQISAAVVSHTVPLYSLTTAYSNRLYYTCALLSCTSVT